MSDSDSVKFPRVIHEITSAGVRCRLVEKEDVFVLEEATTNAMGNAIWTMVPSRRRKDLRLALDIILAMCAELYEDVNRCAPTTPRSQGDDPE